MIDARAKARAFIDPDRGDRGAEGDPLAPVSEIGEFLDPDAGDAGADDPLAPISDTGAFLDPDAD